jgi:hypothetical protein
MLSGDQGPYVVRESSHIVRRTPEMFDLSNHRDDSDSDRWLNTFTEASARLDALQTAVTDLRHLLRHSEGVRSAEILEVLERHGV